MAFNSNATKVAYTVCGHTVEKNTPSHRVEKTFAFLFRRQSTAPARIQGAYGWCPDCTEYYRYDIRNAHCILKFWKFKRENRLIGAVPQSRVPGSVLFDTMSDSEDAPFWPTAMEDMDGFLRAMEYTPGFADVRAFRVLGWSQEDAEHAARLDFSIKMRDATLEWAQAEWHKNWIRVGAGYPGDPEVLAPVLSEIPQHPKPGKANPVLFDPHTRLPVRPNLQLAKPLPAPPCEQGGLPQETSVESRRDVVPLTPASQDIAASSICFTLDYDSSSPSLVDVSSKNSPDKLTPEPRRKATPILNLYSPSSRVFSPSAASTSRSPRSAPPRPNLRLAACSHHGKTIVADDCDECKRIGITEIAVPPSPAHGRGFLSAPLPSAKYVWCSQPLCYCAEVGEDNCPTCPLRAESEAEGVAWM